MAERKAQTSLSHIALMVENHSNGFGPPNNKRSSGFVESAPLQWHRFADKRPSDGETGDAQLGGGHQRSTDTGTFPAVHPDL
jgi:hypothetical protein